MARGGSITTVNRPRSGHGGAAPRGYSGTRAARFLAALLPFCAAPGARAFGEAQKYLIVSSPSTSRIAYLKLPAHGGPAEGDVAMRTLIDKGLTYPQGIAVDEYRRMLYVADPSLGKLVRYRLEHSGDALAVGPMEDVARSVEVRAVAVDGQGTVWFTEEPTQRILRVTAEMMERGQTTPQAVYDGSTLEAVRAPGGVAVDSFFVYWLNKADGQRAGSLLRARQYPLAAAPAGNGTASGGASAAAGSVRSLANNAAKCYGVCIALGNAFYTDEFQNMYGVPNTATARDEVVTISRAFKEPRGCVYDGDSTVYVADKAENVIYQFASNMEQLKPDRPMVKAAELQGPFGVAMYTRLDD